ncbi:MAG: response regulator transcription factor [Proteobacteria bacterium]|nr:response regulator transcription factor [Pseudomonadota bacterium]
MKILIVEDNPTPRLVIRMLLENAGYEVVEAGNGREALSILETKDAPEIILLDWVMPDMDGSEVCRRIRARENRRSTYIIFLSARSSEDAIVAGLEAGADDYITKPFINRELLARIIVGCRIVRTLKEKYHEPSIVISSRLRRLELDIRSLQTAFFKLVEQAKNKFDKLDNEDLTDEIHTIINRSLDDLKQICEIAKR